VFVADHADQLSQWFIFPRQDRHLVRALCSKKEMFFLAKKWNVPTPETTFPASLNDVEQFLATARFPVLLKPIKSGPTSPPIRLVQTKDELLRQYRSWNDPSNLIIQEYIPGPDQMTWTFNGYFDREGKCQLAFTGRKIRNYSPYSGAGSLGVCLHNEEVERLTVEFMASIGYHGPLDLGYRYDVRDGRYKVNDINPRIGAMFRLFVGTNGMDVAQALYQDMMGQPVLPARAPDGRKWIVEDRDWISALVYWRDGKLTFSDWFKSLRGVQEASFFASDDLWPFAGMVADNLRTIWHRMSKRFAGPTNSARLPERQRQRTVS
jgi:predicted ATP-grasp superfamily ATP-dependent carboligase